MECTAAQPIEQPNQNFSARSRGTLIEDGPPNQIW